MERRGHTVVIELSKRVETVVCVGSAWSGAAEKETREVPC